ncbi:acyl-CoA-like ligand-binding transcription factor [Nocardia xishanensis]|uniref:acyl-CoA-like ligand-binding transcription factor n=1 Tax=Nocardia xishanensis TaxID=238964 RepID=UPI0008312B5E|nr:TetR family transcriptional regulator [Nocardia xishanensis]
MAVEAPGLRERKKRETRLALSRAAIRLSIERGWDNVTVEAIAAEANVSVRTFRNYFANKAEAIAASHVERSMRIADELRTRPTDEPLWDSIADAVLAQFAGGERSGADSEDDRRWRDALRLMLAEPALQGEVVKANAAAQNALAAAIAERTSTDATRDVYPQLVAAVIGAGTAAAVEHCLRADEPLPLARVLREVFDRIRAGLPVP